MTTTMFGRWTGAGGRLCAKAEAAALEESRNCRRFKRAFTLLEYVGKAALQMPEEQTAKEERGDGIGR